MPIPSNTKQEKREKAAKTVVRTGKKLTKGLCFFRGKTKVLSKKTVGRRGNPGS